MSRSPAILLDLPKREWRNWQTRQLEVLVGVKSRGGSSPLSRIFRWPGLILRAAPEALFGGHGHDHILRSMSRWASRAFMACRLSCCFLPVPRPMSILTRPSTKYIFKGTMVFPRSRVMLAHFRISRL